MITDFSVGGYIAVLRDGVACSKCSILSEVERSCKGKHVHGDLIPPPSRTERKSEVTYRALEAFFSVL
jgi:hypothetical protein